MLLLSLFEGGILSLKKVSRWERGLQQVLRSIKKQQALLKRHQSKELICSPWQKREKRSEKERKKERKTL